MVARSRWSLRVIDISARLAPSLEMIKSFMPFFIKHVFGVPQTHNEACYVRFLLGGVLLWGEQYAKCQRATATPQQHNQASQRNLL